MIVAGCKLALLGMAVVFFFLLLLILFVRLSQVFLSAGSAREQMEMEATERKNGRRLHQGIEEPLLVAIISAAVAAHRTRTQRFGGH